MPKENEAFIKPFVDKIKQDKLDQRRTVLSEVDQDFVNAVGQMAGHADVELPASVDKIVALEEEDTEAEVEEEEALRPDPEATNKVLKDFMEDHEIAYESDDNKADLNDKIDDWLVTQTQ